MKRCKMRRKNVRLLTNSAIFRHILEAGFKELKLPSSREIRVLMLQVFSRLVLCAIRQVKSKRDWTQMAKVELTPLRSWDDFYPGSERFARPDVKDLAKWNNRVVSNLLYYQTNYLVLAIAVFLVVG